MYWRAVRRAAPGWLGGHPQAIDRAIRVRRGVESSWLPPPYAPPQAGERSSNLPSPACGGGQRGSGGEGGGNPSAVTHPILYELKREFGVFPCPFGKRHWPPDQQDVVVRARPIA